MPMSAEQFAEAVVAAGLASADEIKAFWSALPSEQRPTDGETLAQRLVEAQRLTGFQSHELLSGARTPLVLGDYVLLAKIGAGGMGQVFQARHRRMKRFAALKLLPPALTQNAEAIARFEREVEAAARLSHPNIVQTHDAGVQRDVWYLAMEYVDGCDLAAVVAEEGPLPVARACYYLLQAARGLAYAHENGVVHRDIKPSNLLLDKKGVVKILDMGLARVDGEAAARDGLTQSGQVMGTVDYMAPEQALDTRRVDARADIYSLGCTLYRLLTGQSMYPGETLVQKLMGHQTQPIPSLREKRPDAPPELAAIFERLVAKQPAERVQTMAEVAAALAPFVSSVAPPSSIAAQGGGVAGSGRPAAPRPGNLETRWPGVSLLTNSPPQLADEKELAATVALASPLQATDPVSQRSIQVVREQSSGGTCARTAAPSRRPHRLLLAVGGMGSLLLVLLGVWVIIKDKSGKEVARVQVPAGGSATILPSPLAGERAGIRGNTPSAPQSPIATPPPPTPDAAPPPPARAPFDTTQARAHQEAWAKHLSESIERKIILPGGGELVMVMIPPGEFTMGRMPDESSRFPPNGLYREPTARQHKVTLTRPLQMAATEVTQRQWSEVMGSQPWQGKDRGAVGDDYPATYTTKPAAQEFCRRLSERDGKKYRLPTEAEWEYACRAGSETLFFFGQSDAQLGQYACRGSLQPVASKQPNVWGLFDMLGNVWEWVADGPTDFSADAVVDPLLNPGHDFSILRGSCFRSAIPAEFSSGARHSWPGALPSDEKGFRVVCEVDRDR